MAAYKDHFDICNAKSEATKLRKVTLMEPKAISHQGDDHNLRLHKDDF